MTMTLANRAALALGVATCLLTAGCDSRGTKEVKQEAKAIDQSYRAQADLVEASAKNGPDADRAKMKAQALRDQGEVERKYLVKEAKETEKATH